MNLLNLIGDFSAFIGTILLSAGLLRSEEQIKDEETTYYDGNPFKIKSSIKSQPYYRAGFRFLIIGFSINSATSISKIMGFYNDLIKEILLSVSILIFGFLLIQWFERLGENKHRVYKQELINENFFARLKQIYLEVQDNILGGDKTETDFEIYKNNVISDLDNRKNFLQDNYFSDVSLLIENLKKSKSFESFQVYVEAFLKSNKIIN